MWVGWVHHSWRFGHAEALRKVGPKMPERQRCQSEKLLEFFRYDPNDFLLRLVTIDETRLYHYDPETKQQSMEWWHSSSPRPTPKNSECKNPLETFSLRLFGIKGATSSLIFFQRAKLSTHLCWCNWRTFWRKNAGRRKVTNGVLFLHDDAPARRTLATHKKLAYLGFQCFHHTPYSPELALSDYHLCLGLKKLLKGRHFFPSDSEVIVAAVIWLNGQPSEFFFEWLAKVRATS